LAITPDQPPSNQKKTPADSASVFKPIAPITKPAVVPEPENPENPFVALSSKVTRADLPPKKMKRLSPAVASLLPHNGPLPAARPKDPVNQARKPVNFLNEKVSIAIAPEFMPAKPSAPPKTEMDFSLDYKNPEAERLLNPSKTRPKDPPCHKCGKQTRNGIFFNGVKGPVCPHCYNPYVHQLVSNIYYGRDPEFGIGRALVALFHFIIAWLVPVVPATLWYALFVHTGFGGFFEDTVIIFTAPTIEGLAFAVLLLAGLFFIPACVASVSLDATITGSLAQINPLRLFPLIKMAMPGYFLTFCVLTGTVMMNLAGIALCAEAGMGWVANVLAIFLAVGMGAGEMRGVRWVMRGMVAHIR
jgi:hypothetical protein